MYEYDQLTEIEKTIHHFSVKLSAHVEPITEPYIQNKQDSFVVISSLLRIAAAYIVSESTTKNNEKFDIIRKGMIELFEAEINRAKTILSNQSIQ